MPPRFPQQYLMSELEYTDLVLKTGAYTRCIRFKMLNTLALEYALKLRAAILKDDNEFEIIFWNRLLDQTQNELYQMS